MINKVLSGSMSKRNWGRGMRIDSWDRLELVIDLIKTSLPIGMSIDLNHADFRPPAPPLPYDPRSENSVMMPAPLPILAEVRASFCIDETLAWLLPVQFCINQFLTAEEVVTKIRDAFWFLQGWSEVHSQEAREHLRTRSCEAERSPDSTGSLLVQ